MGYTVTDLKKVLSGVAAGDREAFSVLYDIFFDGCFKFCLYLTNNKQDAEDLFQDSYLKIIQNLNNLQSPDKFKSWALQIVRNLFIDRTRKHTPANFTPLFDDSTRADMSTILTVQTILSQFENEDRMLLLMSELLEMSHAEIAATLSLSETSLKSRIHRLRAKFQDIYKNFETKPTRRSSTF